MPQLSEIAGAHYRDVRLLTIAGGATGETVAFVAPYNCTVTAVLFTPDAAITANGTNFFTLIFRNRGAAGAGTTQVATRAWSATNSSAFVAEAMTLSATAADLNLTAGDVVTLQKTEGGTGLALPASQVRVAFTIR